MVVRGAGFSVYHLCRALTSSGAKVKPLDIINSYMNGNKLHLEDTVQITKCDIVRDDLLTYIRDSDVIFHLAALASPGKARRKLHRAFKVNVMGTNHILRSCGDDLTP